MDNVNTENMSNKEMIEELMRLRAEMNEVKQKLASQENSIKTINSFLAAMTEAQDFGRTMQEVESVTKQLTNCDSAAFYCYDSAVNKFFTAENDSRNWHSEFTEIFTPIMNDKKIKIENNNAIIPITSSKGDVIGVISAEKENGFDNVDFTPFAAGSEIVNTIDLAVRKELNHQTAVTDELTGLKNRDGLNEYINKTLLSNIQEEKPVNILMCDIDHFKSVNDTYGHDAGDIILQGVAKILQENTRSGSDCTFRMGGEEMVCIFNCDAAKAYEVAERVRKEIESTVHKVKSDGGVEHEVKVTISMGLVQMKPEQEMTMFNARQVFDAEFKKADIAVYNAKESGRNQIVASSEIFESYASQKITSYILQNSNFAPAEHNSVAKEIEKMVKISDKETLNQLITEKAAESFEYKSEFKEMTELINKAAEQNDRPVIICIQQNNSNMHRKVDISVNEIKKMLVESNKPYATFATLGKGINTARYAEIEQSGKSISIDINMDENTWTVRADDEFVKECSIDSLVIPPMLKSDKENFLNECQNAEQWADDAIMTENEFGEYLNDNRPNYR